MALATIITKLAAVIAAADPTLAVLEYSRYTPDEKSRTATYAKNGVLNCAIITREASAAKDVGAGADNVRDKHAIAIHCFRAVAAGAESEKALHTAVEAIRTALRANRKLPDGAGWLSAPPQVAEFDTRMFHGAVLAWHAKITVVAEETMQGG